MPPIDPKRIWPKKISKSYLQIGLANMAASGCVIRNSARQTSASVGVFVSVLAARAEVKIPVQMRPMQARSFSRGRASAQLCLL